MLQKLLMNKVKGMVEDFLNELDLDGDGVKDKEQVLEMIDKAGAAIAKLVEAVDLPEAAALGSEIADVMKELNDVLARIKDAVDEEKAAEALKELHAVLAEILAFAKDAIAGLKK